MVEEAELHALVDGELDAERRRAVEDHLLQHPEEAALVEIWRRQNAALRAAFDHVAHEAPPTALRRPKAPAPAPGPIETGVIHWGRPSASRATRRLDDARRNRRKKALLSGLLTLIAGGVAAAAIVLALSGAPKSRPPVSVAADPQGYAGRAEVAYQTFAQDARAVEIDAGRKGELSAWLLRRVGFGLVPDLSPLGLRFLGGRVTPGLREPAGFLVYERDGGDRLSLYFERAESVAAPAPGPRRGFLGAVEWRAAGMAFVLLGPVSAELLQAAGERAAAEVIAPQATPGPGEPGR